MLAALAAVPILIAVAVRVSSAGSSGRGPAFIDQITQNGLFVGVAGLILCIPLFLPLTVGVVAGDTIAGEANSGTLRYLLVAPAGRVRLLIVKFLGAVAFCIAAPLVVVLAGTVIGAILFPLGDVTLLSGDTVPISESLGRALLMSAYVSVSLIGLSAIGLFISTLTDTPVGAMAATIVISVAAQVVGSLDPARRGCTHGCSATTGWASSTCCVSRSCGRASATTPSCSSATSSSSEPSPTAASSRRASSPRHRVTKRRCGRNAVVPERVSSATTACCPHGRALPIASTPIASTVPDSVGGMPSSTIRRPRIDTLKLGALAPGDRSGARRQRRR